MIRLLLLAVSVLVALSACSHFETRDAVLIQDVQPAYPPEARQAGIEGRVIVEYIINEEGIPVDLQIVEASPQGYFEGAALAAISQWRYQPALKYGRPARSPEAEAVLYFELEKNE